MKVITQSPGKEHIDCDVAFVAEGCLEKANLKINKIKKFTSSQLFTEVKEVMIEHQNEVYILRLTKQNKLILTK